LSEIGEVFKSGYINEGLQVTRLNEELSKYLRVKNLVLTNSGTSALTLALKIIGVGIGDEVITISMTCIASNTPIINLGANIVWADIDPRTGSINPEEVRSLITKNTKAILFVDWAGNPCDLDALSTISEEFGLPLIQDAAHAFGAEWHQEPISNWADFTCFSFQAIKHFTTGDGGALVCKNAENHALARKLKWFGYDREQVKDAKGEWKGQRWDADIKPGEVGFKFNMNNVSAAIGLSQFRYIDSILATHRSNAEVYKEFFYESKEFKLLETPIAARSSHWVFTLLYKGTRENRNRLLSELNAKGIGAGLVHLPNHTYSAFKEFVKDLPGTDEFSDNQLSLPCGWWLSKDDCKEICLEVSQIAKKL
jgi:dTDP-4-amino-4,6-dideoxygalactose transaminase